MKEYIREIKNGILDKVIYGVVVGAAIGIAGCAGGKSGTGTDTYRNFSEGSEGKRETSVTAADFLPNPDAEGISLRYLQTTLEGECDVVHLDEQMRTLTKRMEHVLVCEEKSSDNYIVKWAMNLDDICRVYQKENYNSVISKPLDWVTRDDLKIWTNSFHVYNTRLDDDIASKIGEIIQMFVTQNVNENRCGDYYSWVKGKFVVDRHKLPWELKEGGARYVLVLPYSPAELERRQKGLVAFFDQKNKEFLEEVKTFESAEKVNTVKAGEMDLGHGKAKLENGKITMKSQTSSGGVEKNINMINFK